MTNSSTAREASIMAAVNRAIDRLHTSLNLPDSDFFCECGHPACKERVTLTRGEYAGRRDRPVLLPDHAHRPALVAQSRYFGLAASGGRGA